MNTIFRPVETIFRQHGGLLRTSRAIQLGVPPRLLYAMRDAGELVELSRGLYRLAALPPLSQPDLIAAAMKVPRGVVCLISALAFHDLTSQVPHAVYLALPSEAERPRLTHPPLRLFWLSGQAYTAGIDRHTMDEVRVKIYSPEKTVADCFKFRNKIGLEVALEALKRYRERPGFRLQRLQHFARLCRVQNVMRPYLEMLE